MKGRHNMDREKLKNTLKKASGNTTDIFFTLYTDYFENGDNPVEALKTILEYPDKIGDQEDENPSNIIYKEECRLVAAFEEMITGVTNRIVELNLAKNDFYQKLYETIFQCDNEFFPHTKAEKVIALKILSESVSVVPYYQIIETEKVSKEEFESGIDKLWDYIQEAGHMLMHRQFPTTPEEAAQVLRVADGINDRKERIIFWTILINTLRRRGEQE